MLIVKEANRLLPLMSLKFFTLVFLLIANWCCATCNFAQEPNKIALAAHATPGLLEDALHGKARIIDLTHPLNASTPTYNGKSHELRIESLSTCEHDGYLSFAFRMPEHFGTHIDAPAHFSAKKATIDKIDAKQLIVPVAVIDVQAAVKVNPDYQLTLEDVKAWERERPIPDESVVLLLTGWASRYHEPQRYRNQDASGIMHFPGYSLAAAKYLYEQHKVRGLGIDTLSVDYGPSHDYSVHKYMLENNSYLIENLTNLDKLPACGAVIFLGPLPIEGGSGSPARILALAP